MLCLFEERKQSRPKESLWFHHVHKLQLSRILSDKLIWYHFWIKFVEWDCEIKKLKEQNSHNGHIWFEYKIMKDWAWHWVVDFWSYCHRRGIRKDICSLVEAYLAMLNEVFLPLSGSALLLFCWLTSVDFASFHPPIV